jgi:hypothetical protein
MSATTSRRISPGPGQRQLHRRLAAHRMAQQVDLAAQAFDHLGQIGGHSG